MAPTARFITPDGVGGNAGTQWSSARDIASLDEIITELAAISLTATEEHRVFVLGEGDHAAPGTTQVINAGPATGRIRVIGVDKDLVKRRRKRARITGARTRDWKSNLTGANPSVNNGIPLFTLADGAKNLVFENLELRDMLNGFASTGTAGSASQPTNVSLLDVDAFNMERLVECSSAAYAITKLRMGRVRAQGYSRALLRLQGNSHDVILRDLFMDPQGQDFANFSSGLVFSGQNSANYVHDVLVEDAMCRGTVDSFRINPGNPVIDTFTPITIGTPLTLAFKAVIDNSNFHVKKAGVIVPRTGNYTFTQTVNTPGSVLDVTTTVTPLSGGSAALANGDTLTVEYDYGTGPNGIGYAQGDFTSNEEYDRNFVYRRIWAEGCSDRATDNKADNVLVEDSVFTRNKRHAALHNDIRNGMVSTFRRCLFGPCLWPGGDTASVGSSTGDIALISVTATHTVHFEDCQAVYTGQGNGGTDVFPPIFKGEASSAIMDGNLTKLWVPGGAAALAAHNPDLNSGAGATVVADQVLDSNLGVGMPIL